MIEEYGKPYKDGSTGEQVGGHQRGGGQDRPPEHRRPLRAYQGWTDGTGTGTSPAAERSSIFSGPRSGPAASSTIPI